MDDPDRSDALDRDIDEGGEAPCMMPLFADDLLGDDQPDDDTR